jgi:hypothetical protein
MRMLLQATVAADRGTEILKSGNLQKTIQQFSETFKPEATYFLLNEGMRSSLYVFDLPSLAQMPEITEMFFQLGCEVTLSPCMTPQDLQAGLTASGL